jgi:hypothetical protein
MAAVPSIKEKPMTQETALIPVPDQSGDLVLAAISGNSGFLRRLQLMTARSPKVIAEEFPVNHIALIRGNDYQDAGEDIVAVPICYRPTAMSTGGDMVICHDPKLGPDGTPTGLFREIMDKSQVPDSGCFYGPEFLMWLPKQKEFVTLLLSSPTARNEAGAFTRQVGKATLIGKQFIKAKKYSYWSIKASPSSATLGDDEKPNPDSLRSETERFLNPPEIEQATAEEVEATDVAR